MSEQEKKKKEVSWDSSSKGNLRVFFRAARKPTTLRDKYAANSKLVMPFCKYQQQSQEALKKLTD
jgi:hypothetical protein